MNTATNIIQLPSRNDPDPRPDFTGRIMGLGKEIADAADCGKVIKAISQIEKECGIVKADCRDWIETHERATDGHKVYSLELPEKSCEKKVTLTMDGLVALLSKHKVSLAKTAAIKAELQAQGMGVQVWNERYCWRDAAKLDKRKAKAGV